ncbi:MAG TPA: DinB family protein [Chitinophagaceae bacterium]
MKIILSQYAAYHQWANQLIIDRIQKLPSELHDKKVPGSFPGLQATLLHIWDAESIWWQRMKLQENIIVPSANFTGGINEISKSLMFQSRQWQEWISNAQEHMFDHEFIYYNTKKEKFKQSVYQVILHVFNHGTYHRGQLVNILRQLDVDAIPQTDFIIWSRKKSII